MEELEREAAQVPQDAAELAAVSGALGRAGRVERDGAVVADLKVAHAALAGMKSKDVARRYGKSLDAIAENGFAVRNGASAPWDTVAKMLRDRGPVPKPLQGLLGDEIGRVEPGEARRLIRQRFPHLPKFALDDEMLRPRGESVQPRLADAVARELEVVSADGAAQLTSPSLADTVRCLVSAQGRIQWWGWSLCWERDCAATINDFVNTMGILAGAGAVISAGSVAGAALTLPLLFLSFYVFLLDQIMFSLLRANPGRGICMNGNWPTPWFPMVVWPSLK